MIDETMDVDMEGFCDSVAEDDLNNASEGGNGKKGPLFKSVGIGNKAIVRFIYGVPATPLEARYSNPYVAKLVNVQFIKDDAGKWMRLVLPPIINYKPQVPSTLYDFCEAVLAKDWYDFTDEEIAARQADPKLTEKQKKAKGKWVYLYENRNDYGAQQFGSMTLKDIFLKVSKCDADPAGKFYDQQKSWEGQTVYVANVIDRLDPTWHAENKKTKVLMGSVKLKGNKLKTKEASWYRMSSITDFAKTSGSKMNYDVLIKPAFVNGKEATSAPYIFEELTSRKEKDYWSGCALTDEEKKLIQPEALSEAEKNFELVDLGRFYKFTSATQVVERLIKVVDAFDLMTGSNFGPRFRAEAEQEKAAKAAAKAAEGNKAPVAPSAVKEEPVAPVQPTVEPVAPVAPATPQPTQAAPAANANPYGFAPVNPATDFDPSSFYDHM